MKAIEILESINTRYCTDSVIAKINKAISELEALENRSCESCKYVLSNNKIDNVKYLCSNSMVNFEDCCPFDFYCNKWESK